VLRLVRRRSPRLRTQSPLTSNSRATSFRNGASRCRTYTGSANLRRCAIRKLSERTALRRALTRATRRENPLRRPLAAHMTRSAAHLASMTRNTQYAYSAHMHLKYKKHERSRNCPTRQSTIEFFQTLGSMQFLRAPGERVLSFSSRVGMLRPGSSGWIIFCDRNHRAVQKSWL
jgi:hypothetical protein